VRTMETKWKIKVVLIKDGEEVSSMTVPKAVYSRKEINDVLAGYEDEMLGKQESSTQN